MSILSIQSQVIYGHVGNSVAVPALQALGHEVWGVPTALLSHHPGHGAPGGRILTAREVADLIGGLGRLGVLGGCRAVVSGYLGEAANGAEMLAAVAMVRQADAGALYLCDPVMGDAVPGLYVRPDLPAFFRDKAATMADIMTPNRFELEQLTGQPIASVADAVASCRALLALGPRAVVCTSLELPQQDQIGTLAVRDEGSAWLVATPRLAKVPQGSGDLLSALLLGHLLAGEALAEAVALAVSVTFALLRASQGAPELRLVANLDKLRAPGEVFPPAPLP